MNCNTCKEGELKDDFTTVTLERDGRLIIIRDVPCMKCNNCGDYVLTDAITDQVWKIAEQAFSKNAEVEILRFAA